MSAGQLRLPRLVNRADQPPSDWDVIQQWQPKTSSLCQGTLHHHWLELLTSYNIGLGANVTRADLAPAHHVLHTLWLRVWTFDPLWRDYETPTIVQSHKQVDWPLSLSFTILLFFSIETVQRGHATDAPSTSCGRASMGVHSAPRATTERLSAHVSREYRWCICLDVFLFVFTLSGVSIFGIFPQNSI